jgi:cation diffusion facilitator CzcD-associated flavoprotein CzcO
MTKGYGMGHAEDTTASREQSAERQASAREIDAVVIGAGMGGLYAVRRLAADGLTVAGFEGAHDVGGVWLHNAYPGARVDIEAYYYSFFDPEFYGEWEWTDRYPAQPEILSYLRTYADRFDIRRHFQFGTWVDKLHWQSETQRWRVVTHDGQVLDATHVFLATGQLSKSKTLPFPGVEDFTGDWLETSHWPQDPVDLAGRRVAVIGTGSSGVQAITEVAKVAGSLHVFQRTPNYVVPSQNAPIDRERYADFSARIGEVWDQVMTTGGGFIAPIGTVPGDEMDSTQQSARLEEQWAVGGLSMNFAFPDQRHSWETNGIVSDFVRAKIRSVINDKGVADALEPRDYPIGTRRLAVCNGYYETYNRDNVTLVNLKEERIERITQRGIRTDRAEYEFDVIISALGFDAFSGPVDAIDIRNAEGERPSDHWQQGPNCYIGLMLHNFPNMYFLAGPGSPSVLANFNVHNVFHVDVVADLLNFMRERGYATVEPNLEAQKDWRVETQRAADGLLRNKVDNYMSHVNEDGTRFFVPYAGGWNNYVEIVRAIERDNYSTFEFHAGDDTSRTLLDAEGALA